MQKEFFISWFHKERIYLVTSRNILTLILDVEIFSKFYSES